MATISFQKQKTEAFTLVELAIVIVIIGLLVGGVLAGQELIKQAKWRSAMKEIEGYKGAMATFFGKYNCIPGDCAQGFRFFGSACGTDQTITPSEPNGCNGNGNKVFAQHEGQLMWKHLSLGKMIKGSFTQGFAAAPKANINLPASSIENNVGIVPVFSQGPESTATSCGYLYCLNDPLLRLGAIGRNLLNLGGSDSAESGMVRGGFFTPVDAYEFDVKFDDGLYFAGTISGYVGFDASNVQGNCGLHTSKAYHNTHATYSNLRGCRMVFDTGF